MFEDNDVSASFNEMYEIYKSKMRAKLADPAVLITENERDIFQEALKKTNLNSVQQRATFFLYESFIAVGKKKLLTLICLDEQQFFELIKALLTLSAHKLIKIQPGKSISLDLITYFSNLFEPKLNVSPKVGLNEDANNIIAIAKILQQSPSFLSVQQEEMVQSIKYGDDRRKVYRILHFLYQAHLLNDTSFKEVMEFHPNNLSELLKFLSKMDSDALTLAPWKILAEKLKQDVYLYPLTMLSVKLTEYKVPLNQDNIGSCIRIWAHIYRSPGYVNILDKPFLNILNVKGLLTSENLKILENFDYSYSHVIPYLYHHNILTQDNFSKGIKWREMLAHEEIRKIFESLPLDANIHQQAFDYLIEQACAKKDLMILIDDLNQKITILLDEAQLEDYLYTIDPASKNDGSDEEPIPSLEKMDYYELAELIYKRYLKAGIEISTTSDILEYMVLEYAGVLKDVQNLPLKCVTAPDSHSNLIFFDRKMRSGIEFGFHAPVSKEQEKQLYLIVKKIIKATDSDYDDEHAYYNFGGTEHSIIIRHEEIICALNSSSLLKAAGKIDLLKLNELVALKQQVKLYDLADKKISLIAERLVRKLDKAIKIARENQCVEPMDLEKENPCLEVEIMPESPAKANSNLSLFFPKSIQGHPKPQEEHPSKPTKSKCCNMF